MKARNWWRCAMCRKKTSLDESAGLIMQSGDHVCYQCLMMGTLMLADCPDDHGWRNFVADCPAGWFTSLNWSAGALSPLAESRLKLARLFTLKGKVDEPSD